MVVAVTIAVLRDPCSLVPPALDAADPFRRCRIRLVDFEFEAFCGDVVLRNVGPLLLHSPMVVAVVAVVVVAVAVAVERKALGGSNTGLLYQPHPFVVVVATIPSHHDGHTAIDEILPSLKWWRLGVQMHGWWRWRRIAIGWPRCLGRIA